MDRRCIALLAWLLLAGPAGAGELAAGDPAPEFSLQGSDGRSYRLEQFVGRQGLVLAWFPKAFTGG